MELTLKHTDKSIHDIMELTGYTTVHFQREGEFSIVRPLKKSGYPRFHLYGTQQNSTIILNLHLEQEKPSFESVDGHTGDADSPAVKEEMERIEQLLNANTNT